MLLAVITALFFVKWITLGPSAGRSDLLFASSLATSPAAGLGLGYLLYREKQQLSKPSNLASWYLVAVAICDVLALTAPSSVPLEDLVKQLLLVRLGVHVLLLVLESFDSRPTTDSERNLSSPEERSGIIGKAFFSWINPILARGYKNLLVDSDLPPLSCDIKPDSARKAALAAWSQRG